MSYKPFAKQLAKKRKIAVCLSGYVRSYEDCVPSFREHILQDQDCEVFIHTWDKLDYFLRTENPEPLDQTKLLGAYNPIKYLIESQPNWEVSELMKNSNKENRDCAGILSMFYSIYQANELRKQQEEKFNFKYDVVIRLRPDMVFQSRLEMPLQMSTDRVYIPVHGDFGGLNDQFAYGSSDVMNQYSETYTQIDRLISEGAWVNPEILTKTNLSSRCLGVNRFNLSYVLKRMNHSTQNNFERQYVRVK